MNLTYSFAEVLSDDGFQLSLKKAFTTPTNKDVFNSILKKLRKGRSSHPKVFCKKGKKPVPGSLCARVSCFNKVAGLRPGTGVFL